MSLIEWKKQKTRLDPRSLAVEVASAGALEGTLIQGTADRKALTFSVVLRPRRGARTGLLAVIATFCASEGIRKDTGVITWIRWPDEVVVEKAVLAVTSLTEGGPEGSRWVILSFRINRGGFRGPGSISLKDLLGVQVDSDLLVAKVLDSFSWMHSGWVKEMYPQILTRLTSMLEIPEETVAVVDRDGSASVGVTKGVDERGRLIVELGGTGARVTVEEGPKLVRF